MGMAKKCRKGLICLFKVLYEIGAFAMIYFVIKYFAESVG